MAEITTSYFATSIVIVPKFLKHVTEKPFFISLSERFPSLQWLSTLSPHDDDTKSGNQFRYAHRKAPGRPVTDVDYNELVKNTLSSRIVTEIVCDREGNRASSTLEPKKPELAFITMADV